MELTVMISVMIILEFLNHRDNLFELNLFILFRFKFQDIWEIYGFLSAPNSKIDL